MPIFEQPFCKISKTAWVLSTFGASDSTFGTVDSTVCSTGAGAGASDSGEVLAASANSQSTKLASMRQLQHSMWI